MTRPSSGAGMPNVKQGYKKEKLGANTYWMDKNNNVIEEVIKEEF